MTVRTDAASERGGPYDPWRQVVELQRRGWSGAGIAVGHLDSGLDATHPALAGRIAEYLHFDEHGEADPTRGCFDEDGHGTHVAGVLCGRFREPDALGVAPRVELRAAGVIEKGKVVARTLSGMDWILSRPIRVLAMPFGLRGVQPVFSSMIDAARAKGILLIVPVGNDGAGRCRSPGDDGAVLSVGAADASGEVAPFSGSVRPRDGYTCHKPDLLAPGVDVLSACPGGGLAAHSGTSMASAFVAGVAALLFQACPDASPEDVIAALVETARPLAVNQRYRCAHGLVQPLPALERLTAKSARAPRAWPQRRLVRHRDQRLMYRCLNRASDAPIDAAFVWQTEPGCRAELRSRLVQLFPSGSLLKVRVLNHGGVALLRAEAGALLEVMKDPSVRIACALDAPRFLL